MNVHERQCFATYTQNSATIIIDELGSRQLIRLK